MKRTKKNSINKQSLFFLPGWGFQSSIWQPITPLLLDYEIILYDLPLVGHSTTFNLDRLIYIIKTIANNAPPDSILIAWSLSSIIASFLCLHYPHQFKKLITIASTPKFTESIDWEGVKYHLASRFYANTKIDPSHALHKFKKMIGAQINDPSILSVIQTNSMDASNKVSLLFYLTLLIKTDIREIYSRLTQPVLHLFGTRDPIITMAHIKQIQYHYPKHFTQVIPNAGHIPFLTHTQEFVSYLTHFIQQ
ncbi:MAG: alpha/beta fold hydrolase [Gammaproteobacteria bacterium]|nr:alpha/beta fold hydrolase [Gammaproteobacteria bacterium]MCW5583114.1 alpha/beta fold hydrolase [Gammaproteobacteria bacterium]